MLYMAQLAQHLQGPVYVDRTPAALQGAQGEAYEVRTQVWVQDSAGSTALKGFKAHFDKASIRKGDDIRVAMSNDGQVTTLINGKKVRRSLRSCGLLACPVHICPCAPRLNRL